MGCWMEVPVTFSAWTSCLSGWVPPTGKARLWGLGHFLSAFPPPGHSQWCTVQGWLIVQRSALDFLLRWSRVVILVWDSRSFKSHFCVYHDKSHWALRLHAGRGCCCPDHHWVPVSGTIPGLRWVLCECGWMSAVSGVVIERAVPVGSEGFSSRLYHAELCDLERGS